MTNFEFLKKYQQLQTGIMFDSIVNFDFTSISYCDIDKTTFWNWALVNKLISDKELFEIEQSFKSFKRDPSFYLENRKDLKPLVDYLSSKGYEKDYEDSWMFWKGNEINTTRFDEIKKVKDENDLNIYLKTFDASYKSDDPQNPYGELGDYLEVSKNVWLRHGQTSRLEYFVAYKDNKPVAVSTLTNYDGIGYISNVGSLKEVRGEGYGKLATLYCVEQSKKNGNNEHCLATEEGDYPNEFYKRIGFGTRFIAVGYSKIEKSKVL